MARVLNRIINYNKDEVYQYVQRLEVLAESLAQHAQKLVKESDELPSSAFAIAIISSSIINRIKSIREFFVIRIGTSASNLKGINLEELQQKLDYQIKKEKVYLEDDVSLRSLAESLGITPHQLSEFLNMELKQSFYSFINSYRVEEAKLYLRNEPESTILRIAYAVGFSSKSSFHNSFVKLTGMTPSQFRQCHTKAC